MFVKFHNKPGQQKKKASKFVVKELLNRNKDYASC